MRSNQTLTSPNTLLTWHHHQCVSSFSTTLAYQYKNYLIYRCTDTFIGTNWTLLLNKILHSLHLSTLHRWIDLDQFPCYRQRFDRLDRLSIPACVRLLCVVVLRRYLGWLRISPSSLNWSQSLSEKKWIDTEYRTLFNTESQKLDKVVAQVTPVLL